MRLRSLAALTPLLLLCAACSAADLRTPELLQATAQSGASTEAAADRLAAARPELCRSGLSSAAEVRIKARDVWASGLLRQFTPLPSNDERLEFVWRPGHPDVRAEFLGGARQGEFIGVRDGRAYSIVEGREEIDDAAGVRVYLESARLYIEAPCTLATLGDARPAGEREIDGQRYDLVFVSSAVNELSSESDQYLAWIVKNNSQLALIQFTYRELYSSYAGALHYSGLATLGPAAYFTRIAVTDGPDDSSPVHALLLEDARFR